MWLESPAALLLLLWSQIWDWSFWPCWSAMRQKKFGSSSSRRKLDYFFIFQELENLAFISICWSTINDWHIYYFGALFFTREKKTDKVMNNIRFIVKVAKKHKRTLVSFIQKGWFITRTILSWFSKKSTRLSNITKNRFARFYIHDSGMVRMLFAWLDPGMVRMLFGLSAFRGFQTTLNFSCWLISNVNCFHLFLPKSGINNRKLRRSNIWEEDFVYYYLPELSFPISCWAWQSKEDDPSVPFRGFFLDKNWKE